MSIKEMEAKVMELKELQRMQDELEAEIDSLKDAIKAAMGDQEQIIAGAFKITYKAVSSSRVDTTALKKAMPEVAAQFTKTTTSHRLTIA
ncbi:MAG: hypothetical protein E7320_03710 [Clostridiales bacterium]|nr:hypothetical protein [Clostridiales bacterium]